MAKTEAASGGNARTRLRSVITTVLLILISVMIVRDILVRRWTGAAPPSQDTTQQSR
ncbi:MULTISPECIES: hypothetical protein [unclassified Bradyrhizobium]|uniref:hypothetical protein n=1 Tax=unclassified Bradyrhizobium TaxID=2631580 RepID=UPI00247A7E55|nr:MULTISPECIES: hypothetical protein [unclassified Bradyrhizobium]WGR72353.1 hypothetical protein MTX24_05265 [Bradyrhizobium sp. ISRA426]WGR77186.1 hypothetical protein MTX21_30215 [Bradyrhizobium sp. ISRA430]WGR87592.1 hypothetical protein MTX25_05265 [Bradyrhizobium sp. ISRA432]